jgi:hypothetical protein
MAKNREPWNTPTQIQSSLTKEEKQFSGERTLFSIHGADKIGYLYTHIHPRM